MQENHAERDNPEETCQKETRKEVENHVKRDEAGDLGRIWKEVENRVEKDNPEEEKEAVENRVEEKWEGERGVPIIPMKLIVGKMIIVFGIFRLPIPQYACQR